MNFVAIILAVIAIILFVCDYLDVSRRWASTALGLAFLAAAWMAQLILVGMHQYAVH